MTTKRNPKGCFREGCSEIKHRPSTQIISLPLLCIHFSQLLLLLSLDLASHPHPWMESLVLWQGSSHTWDKGTKRPVQPNLFFYYVSCTIFPLCPVPLVSTSTPWPLLLPLVWSSIFFAWGSQVVWRLWTRDANGLGYGCVSLIFPRDPGRVVKSFDLVLAIALFWMRFMLPGLGLTFWWVSCKGKNLYLDNCPNGSPASASCWSLPWLLMSVLV